MIYGGSLIKWAAAAALAAMVLDAPVHADARITGLADVAFGTINAPIDQSNTQNVSVCSRQGTFSRAGYSVQAIGSGSGGAFTLSSGAATLDYDVQWADATNQTSGTMLQPGVASGGFGSGADLFACFFQLDTASLIVTIRAAQLASATAGNYTGTLQVVISPE
jgi:spore coat protein U-like protein